MSKMDDVTRRQRLRAKNRYNLVTGILYLLYTWSLVAITVLGGLLAVVYYPSYGMGSVFAALTFTFFFLIFWLWFVERVVLRFGRLTPKVVSMLLNDYFWFHERYWKLNGLWLVAPLFKGTPFKNVVSRLQGVRMGRKVFDDGSEFDEDTLVEVGDYTNLNAECVIQPHSLEEGVFKSDYVKIGKGCTLGVASNVHYGVIMGDYVVLEPNAFVMKGEIADTDTTWGGNPARAVSESTVHCAQPGSPEAIVPARVALRSGPSCPDDGE